MRDEGSSSPPAPIPAHLAHDCPACRSRRGENCWIQMSQYGEPQGELTTVDEIWTHLARVQLGEAAVILDEPKEDERS